MWTSLYGDIIFESIQVSDFIRFFVTYNTEPDTANSYMATKKTPKQPKPKKFEALIKKALEYNPNKTGSVKVYSNNKSK